MAASSPKRKDTKSTNANGVVIRVYVESVKTRSTKKPKPHEHLRNSETEGYQNDRRALLLAHSRFLRKSPSQNISLPIINPSTPKIKTKGVWLNINQPVRICSCSPSMETLPSLTIRCRNEFKVNKEDNQSEETKSSGKYSNPLLGKMKNILKQLSCKEI